MVEKIEAVVVGLTQITLGVRCMENTRLLLEKGLISGIVIAAVLAGFAGFLYLLHRLIKLMRPKEVRQE